MRIAQQQHDYAGLECTANALDPKERGRSLLKATELLKIKVEREKGCLDVAIGVCAEGSSRELLGVMDCPTTSTVPVIATDSSTGLALGQLD